MSKLLKKVIELTVEEYDKEEIVKGIVDYLVKNNKEDYESGDILVKSDRFEAVDVIIYYGCCTDTDTLIKVLEW